MEKVEKYRRLPNGFSALLNKMLRAVLISRPLEAVYFFADYLEAEVNRRTLCDLQLRQPCPSGALQPIDPWVQYMSFVTIQKAIEALLQEERPTMTSFQWDDTRHLKVLTPKCGASHVRRRLSHKPFHWPPVFKATPRCRRRFDRYGPIVEKISITSRSIKRYMTDEGVTGVAVDHCRGRRPIANYWRQILRDCSDKADQWNRKTEHPRRRLRSSSLTTDVRTGAEGEETDADEGSGSQIDPYLEPKRRRKAKNDEGLAKIIYRDLGSRLPPLPVGKPPSEVEDKLPPGKASKAVQVELVPSRLPGRRPPQPTDEAIPVHVLDKAVQVGMDDEDIAEDTTAVYPPPDVAAAEMDVCPPPPMLVPLAIDWTPFLQGPTGLWSEGAIDWLTMIYQEEQCDGEDVPALQAEPSCAAEKLAEEAQFLQYGDLDFPAAATVPDAPALPLEETDAPADSALADAPAEALDHVNDVPAVTAAADVPADPLMPAKESAAHLMDEDEMDDPFSDEGPPVPLVTSEGQVPVLLVTSEGEEPLTSEGQEPVTSEGQEPVTSEGQELVTLEGQEPVPLVTSEVQEPMTSEGQELVTLEGQEPVTSEGQELVTSEGQEPMTFEGQEPVTLEGQELVTSEGQEPITSEEQELLTSEDHEPVTSEGQELLTSKGQEPVTSEDQELLTSEGQEPVTSEGQELLTLEGQEPVTSEGQEPLTSEGQEPVTSEGQELLTSEGQEPVTSEGQELLISEGQELVTSEGQEPLASEGQEPVTSEGQDLVTSEGQEPVASEGQEPVTSEVQDSVPLLTSEGQEPLSLVTSEGQGSSTLLPETEQLKASEESTVPQADLHPKTFNSIDISN